ncbi:MAG: chaperone protein DnaJ [Bryobacterales bacterium]|nr:chaperone protein DnaJ [Bryobacterales bacterium]
MLIAPRNSKKSHAVGAAISGIIDTLPSKQSYYDTLQVPTSASADEIRQAFLDLVRVWHPDRFASDSRLQRIAEDKLKEISEAYQVLSGASPARNAVTAPPGSADLPVPSGQTWDSALWIKTFGFGGLFLGLFFIAGSGLNTLLMPIHDRAFMKQEALRMARLFGPEPAIGSDDPGSLDVVRAGSRTSVISRRKQRADPRPLNGADLAPPRGGGGLGELNVRNESDLDCILRVVTRDSPAAPLRIVYMRAGQEALIQGLQPNIYRLRVAFGRDLNSSSLEFMESDADEYWVGPLQFFQVESSKSRHGVRYNVGLRSPASASFF